MKKVDELSEPLKVGEIYLVPCIIEQDIELLNANSEWTQSPNGEMYLPKPIERLVESFMPVINHPHNDIENGQRIVHYHVETRFDLLPNSKLNLRRLGYDAHYIRIEKTEDAEIVYIAMICKTTQESHKTHPNYIRKSRLKHKCIHKGKCPHRGYDLSGEAPDENGIITCPLHGLKFDSQKRLINDPT